MLLGMLSGFGKRAYKSRGYGFADQGKNIFFLVNFEAMHTDPDSPIFVQQLFFNHFLTDLDAAN